ncbi:hypothetical protein, partial [Enterobacter hormaechei]|uniref:hypothetical protein n=1 Tax=Enterobacter hormaechei TaxID=158836 RepID=UPI001952FE56
RQDKSFQTQSYDIDAATIGTSTLKNLNLSGGSIGPAGGAGVDIALNTLPVSATTASLTAAGGTDFSAADPDMSALAGKTVTLTAGSTTASYT